MILSEEQIKAGMVLLGIGIVVWIVMAIIGTPTIDEGDGKGTGKGKAKRYRTWEERKDSMKRADSIRYAEWSAERELRYDSFKLADSLRREGWKLERELRYDSFRLADSLRREGWKLERQQKYDSFKLADSLWRDSVGWKYVRHEKRDTVLDLNKADTSELQLLRGIGRYTAVQIVKYREQLGGFVSVEQLKDEELADLRLDTLLAHFTIDSTEVETMDVNRCNTAVLARHPYLRYEQAKAIYTLRRKNVRLKGIEELRALPELSDEDIERLKPYLRFN